MTATTRPVLLDLFCGAGGAGMGYSRAGFHVIGVDSAPQPHYPFAFFQMDWREGLEQFGHMVHAIHASPPCQRYSITRTVNSRYSETVDLVPEVRDALKATGIDYVIENVLGSPLINPVTLCGQMFGLRVLRHRLFEVSRPVYQPDHVPHHDFIPFLHQAERAFADAMGCEWMPKLDARQSVPPIYTEFIGAQL